MVAPGGHQDELSFPGELEGAVGGDLRGGWGAGQGGRDTCAA